MGDMKWEQVSPGEYRAHGFDFMAARAAYGTRWFLSVPKLSAGEVRESLVSESLTEAKRRAQGMLDAVHIEALVEQGLRDHESRKIAEGMATPSTYYRAGLRDALHKVIVELIHDPEGFAAVVKVAKELGVEL